MTTYLYEGNTVKVTDPAGKWKTFTMDAQGNLVQVEEPRPGGGVGATFVTTYTYDYRDKLKTVTMVRDGVTQVRTFAYDALGRMTSSTLPENGTTSYTYTDFPDTGTRVTKTDAKGQKIETNRDQYGRITSVIRYRADQTEDTSQRVTFVYHAFDQPSDLRGRLKEVVYANGVKELYDNYTAAGLPLSKGLFGPGGQTGATLTANYGYDNEGRRTYLGYPAAWLNSSTYAAGREFNYEYDSMGRPTRMKEFWGDPQQTQDWAANAQYNAAGQLTSVQWVGSVGPLDHQYGLMVTQSRTYNERNQMTRQTVTGQMDIEYFYSATNNDGRLTGSKDVISGEEVTYLYDELGRLTRAETVGPQWGNSYVFDGFGSLKQKDVTKGTAPTLSLQIDGNTNRIAAGQGFGYDNNGNLTTRPGQTLSYDIDNRLAQVTYSGGSETYAYYANNQRMKKGDTYYFYGAGGEELGTFGLITYEGEQNPKWVRGRVKVQSIGGAMWINGELQYSDRLGSVVRKGGVTQRYYPYGEDRDPGAAGPKHFATYEKDDATGLHYAQQRYYENSVGRFLSPDPYQASGGPQDPNSWNRYAYVEGDPVNYIDQHGLAACSVIWSGDSKMYGAFAFVECLTMGGSRREENLFINHEVPIGLNGAQLNAYFEQTWGAQLDRQEWYDTLDALGSARWDIITMEYSSDCVQLIESIVGVEYNATRGIRASISDVVSAAKRADFRNGLTTTDVLPGIGVRQTFNNVHQYALAEIPGYRTWWRPGVERTNTISSMRGKVLHELLHNAGFGDNDIQQAFFGIVDPADTDNISRELDKICFRRN